MGLNSIQPMSMVHGIRFLTSQENLTFNCYNTGGCTLYYYTQQEVKKNSKYKIICSSSNNNNNYNIIYFPFAVESVVIVRTMES